MKWTQDAGGERGKEEFLAFQESGMMEERAV